MLSLALLDAIASVVWARYRAYVDGESAPPWPPLDVPLGLRVDFQEFPQPAPAFQYRCCVEIGHSTGDRVIGWNFTTSETRRPEGGLAEHNQLLREFRLASRKLGELADKKEPYVGQFAQDWDRASEHHGQLAAQLNWMESLPKTKALQRAWQTGDREALGRQYGVEAVQQMGPAIEARRGMLGPILLSSETSLEELSLKLILFSVRLDRLDFAAWEPAVRRLARFIRRDRSVAAEVLSRGALNYVSDRSRASFKSYLRAIARVYARSHHGEFEDGADAMSRRQADWNRPRTGLDQEDHLRPELRGGRRVPSRWPVEPVPHPWVVGEPALLARIADDFNIPPHIARQWLRDGKIHGRSCLLRVEPTRTGTPARGKIEIPAHERARWQARCTGYHAMRLRKQAVPVRGEPGYDAARRQALRVSNKLGGSLDSARKAVLEYARMVGLG